MSTVQGSLKTQGRDVPDRHMPRRGFPGGTWGGKVTALGDSGLGRTVTPGSGKTVLERRDCICGWAWTANLLQDGEGCLDAELEKVGGVQRGYFRQAWECKGQEALGCRAGEGSNLTELWEREPQRLGGGGPTQRLQ